MIRLGRRATLLVALSLLTSAATACAECAWVLWSVVNYPPEAALRPEFALPGYAVADAFSSQEVCLKAAGVARVTNAPPGADVFYLCLPDTVDPRGPKGR
jgi:hypothetical protein